MATENTAFRRWGLRIALGGATLYALLGAVLFAWTLLFGSSQEPSGEAVVASESASGAVATPGAFPLESEEGAGGIVVPSRGRSSLPHDFIFPVRGEHRLIRSFGDPRGTSRSHAGVDILAPKGTPVVAAADGVVRWIHDEVGGNCCHLALVHEGGWRTKYVHLNNDTPGTDDGRGYGIASGLARGVEVRAGELVGWVGDSGNAENTGSHLHFEILRPDGRPLDPYRLLESAPSRPSP